MALLHEEKISRLLYQGTSAGHGTFTCNQVISLVVRSPTRQGRSGVECSIVVSIT